MAGLWCASVDGHCCWWGPFSRSGPLGWWGPVGCGWVALMGVHDRMVVERADGGVEVRPRRRRAVFNDRKRRVLLDLVAGGVTIAEACRQVGVDGAAVARARRTDPGFEADLADAREAFGYELEAVAVERAVHGAEQDVFFKGEHKGKTTVRSDRLMERALEASHRGYRREPQVQVAVQVAALSADELKSLRDLGRDEVEAADVLAARFAAAEAERDRQLVGSGS